MRTYDFWITGDVTAVLHAVATAVERGRRFCAYVLSADLEARSREAKYLHTKGYVPRKIELQASVM
jgi:hypothetical protein